MFLENRKICLRFSKNPFQKWSGPFFRAYEAYVTLIFRRSKCWLPSSQFFEKSEKAAARGKKLFKNLKYRGHLNRGSLCSGTLKKAYNYSEEIFFSREKQREHAESSKKYPRNNDHGFLTNTRCFLACEMGFNHMLSSNGLKSCSSNSVNNPAERPEVVLHELA